MSDFLMPKKVTADDNGGVNPDVILIQSHIDRKLNELFAVKGKPFQWANKQFMMSAEGTFNFDVNQEQFSVQNSSTFVIKIALDRAADTTHYDIVIPALTLYVSPPFTFKSLGWVIDSYAVTTVNPFLIAYQDGRLAPGYHSISLS